MEKKGYLGCDVSKGYCDFILLDANEKVIEPAFRLTDDKMGREVLISLIEKWFTIGVTELLCGVESTGGYESNWFHFLRGLSPKMHIKTARLNARAVKGVSVASLKRTITDAVSAETIAKYLMKFSEKIDYGQQNNMVCNEEFSDGRKHLKFVTMLIKQKVQFNNQLEKHMYQHFSELLIYCRNGIPNWLLSFLVQFPSAKSAYKAGPQRISKIKGITFEKAESILKKLDTSRLIENKRMEHIISTTAKEILYKASRIKEEEDYIVDQYHENELVKLLLTIPGVGLSSAVKIMLEIEEISKFERSNKLACYFGVHPTFKQSGDGNWGSHMSKKGRSPIRMVLYMASLAGIRFNPILKATYAKFRAKGMKHLQAMGAVMHKLLRIIFGILKSKLPFSAEIDINNVINSETKRREDNSQKKEVQKEKKTNLMRFEIDSFMAPISKWKARQLKKETSVPDILVDVGAG